MLDFPPEAKTPTAKHPIFTNRFINRSGHDLLTSLIFWSNLHFGQF